VERVEGLGAVLDLSNFTAFELFFDEAFARVFLETVVFEACPITCDVVSAQVKDCTVSATKLFRFEIESLLNVLPGRADERAAL
jgi:hypothetical protein